MTTAVRMVDVSAIIDSRRLTGFNYGLIALSWLITVFDGFDMMLVSFTAPYMRDEFGLSKMMLGRVFSAGLVGMMLGGFLFSFVADRIGRRPALIAAAYGFGLLTVATGFAGSYDSLLVLRFLDGLSVKEAADAMGISVANAKVLQHRALRMAGRTGSTGPVGTA